MKTDEDVTRRLREASLLVELPPDPLGDLVGRRARRRRRQRLASAAIGLMLVAGIVGGALASMRIGPSGHSRLGGGSGPLELAPGQYFYLKQIVIAGPGGDGSRTIQETWWAPDGSGQLRFDTNRPDKYVPYPPEGLYGKGEFPLPYQERLSSLSTDPNVLKEQLRSRSAGTNTGETTHTIRRLLGLPQALPELRAALFEVAAGLPGFVRHDGVRDPLGRKAVSLELADDGAGAHWVMYFDPYHHQLMSVSEARSDLNAVHPFWFLESAIVDARGAQPTTAQLLFPAMSQTPTPPPPAPASSKS
jgi:hypothetical protein